MNKDYSNPFDEIRRWLKTANQQIMDHEYNSIIINLLLCLLVIVCTIVIVLGDIFFAVMRLFKALYYVVLKLSEKAKTMKKGFAWDTVIYCCLFTVALTALMYFGMRFIHQKAKETNQMVIKYKDTNYEDVFSYYETPNLKEYCPYTTGTNYDQYFSAALRLFD